MVRAAPLARWAAAALAVVAALGPGVASAGARSVAPGPAVDDPAYVDGLEWHLDVIGAPEAWRSSTGQGVLVAVVDSGIDADHPDLRTQVAGQADCVGADGDADRCHGRAADDDGHGTHVAGLVAARANDGVGVAGVAPGARLLAVRALTDVCDGLSPCRPSGRTADLAAGVRWATAHGARVVNLSVGADALGPDLRAAIGEAWDQGTVTVLAAGNQHAPADLRSLPLVLVTAVDRRGVRASYASPVGTARWALAAPGGDAGDTAASCRSGGEPLGIFSTWWRGSGDGSGYACEAGTSMAAPQVSGALAVLLSMGYAPEAAVERLLSTARDLGSPGRDLQYGAGELDVARAVAGPLPAGVRARAAGVPKATGPTPPRPTTGPLAAAPATGASPRRALPTWLVVLGGALSAAAAADLAWRWTTRRKPAAAR